MILVRKYIIVNKLLSIKVMTISIKLLGNIKFEKENKLSFQRQIKNKMTDTNAPFARRVYPSTSFLHLFHLLAAASCYSKLIFTL